MNLLQRFDFWLIPKIHRQLLKYCLYYRVSAKDTLGFVLGLIILYYLEHGVLFLSSLYTVGGYYILNDKKFVQNLQSFAQDFRVTCYKVSLFILTLFLYSYLLRNIKIYDINEAGIILLVIPAIFGEINLPHIADLLVFAFVLALISFLPKQEIKRI